MCADECEWVCVCVYVCERERETDRQRIEVCMCSYWLNIESRFSYITLPWPETGSQPILASNPVLQQYANWLNADEQQLFLPIIISLYLFLLFILYNVGFMNPTVPNPFFCLSLFINDIIPANTGVDADVPYK